MKGITISEMKLGDSASFTKTVSEHDVYTYAGVSGDFNPAHVNEVEAQKGMFGKRIAHGMLSAGFISTVLGTQLPGPGTIYMGQELRFTKPVFFGDTITATVTVAELIPEKCWRRTYASTRCASTTCCPSTARRRWPTSRRARS